MVSFGELVVKKCSVSLIVILTLELNVICYLNDKSGKINNGTLGNVA